MTSLHTLGNLFLTGVTNIFYRTSITDMETCYKLFRRETIQGSGLNAIGLTSNRKLPPSFSNAGCALLKFRFPTLGEAPPKAKRLPGATVFQQFGR